MQHYQGHYLEQERGNNAFAYQERGENAKLWVAPLHFGRPEQIQLGKKAVFAEVNEDGQVQTFAGLQAFWRREEWWVPIYLFDNHNHALYFWYCEYFADNLQKGTALLHIDQHSDMKDNPHHLDDGSLDQIFDFVQEQCNVGNFIRPALQTGLISEVVQVRSEYGLLHLPMPEGEFVLDIDLDFWAEEMGIEQLEATFKQIRKLISMAKVVTIATSPYFLDQEKAIQYLKSIFEKS